MLKTISFALQSKPKRVIEYVTRQPISYIYNKKTKVFTIHTGKHQDVVDYVIEVEK